MPIARMYLGVRAVLETGETLKVLDDIDTTLRLVGPVTALLKAGKDQLAGDESKDKDKNDAP